MPSRSNPNTPSSQKRKTASTLKSKRLHTQRLARNKITKPTPRTSQALRQAAPLSKKKARKLEKKLGFAKQREMEAMGEVAMKDVDNLGKKGRRQGAEQPESAEQKMELDPAE